MPPLCTSPRFWSSGRRESHKNTFSFFLKACGVSVGEVFRRLGMHKSFKKSVGRKLAA
jgi:hypothetical protein